MERPAHRIPRPNDPLAVYDAKRVLNDDECGVSVLAEALDEMLKYEHSKHPLGYDPAVFKPTHDERGRRLCNECDALATRQWRLLYGSGFGCDDHAKGDHWPYSGRANTTAAPLRPIGDST